MKIEQYIKSLNNTELGKGNTHECYVLVSSKVPNMNNFFNEIDEQKIKSLNTNKNIKGIHVSSGRELRINGLGEYYRSIGAQAGDEILFEKRYDGTETKYFINIKHFENRVTFQKSSQGFEILNFDNATEILNKNLNGVYKSKEQNIFIKFKGTYKKRNDSPQSTDFYDIEINGVSILKEIKHNSYLKLDLKENKFQLKPIITWQKFEFNI